jgi:hypothetical protein
VATPVSEEAFTPQPQVPAEHYAERAYNSKERICSYWHQVDEVTAAGARNVLEVGPGAGMVTEWLRRTGVDVTTLDMDPAVDADLHGSVTSVPVGDAAVDAALCCQVLEHLPFEQVEPALRELARVARLRVIISVPDATPWAGVAYPLWFPGWYLEEARNRMPAGRVALLRALAHRRFRLRDWLLLRLVPGRWSTGGRTLEWRPPVPSGPWQPEPGGQHYWEVGSEGHPLERLTAAADRAGLELLRTFRVPENPWHRFLVLKPR